MGKKNDPTNLFNLTLGAIAGAVICYTYLDHIEAHTYAYVAMEDCNAPMTAENLAKFKTQTPERQRAYLKWRKKTCENFNRLQRQRSVQGIAGGSGQGDIDELGQRYLSGNAPIPGTHPLPFPSVSGPGQFLKTLPKILNKSRDPLHPQGRFIDPTLQYGVEPDQGTPDFGNPTEDELLGLQYSGRGINATYARAYATDKYDVTVSYPAPGYENTPKKGKSSKSKTSTAAAPAATGGGATAAAGKLPYASTGKTWQFKDSGKTKRNYASGGSSGTTEWNAEGMGAAANLMGVVYYTHPSSCGGGHGDEADIKMWGPHHSDGGCCWCIVNINGAGQVCSGGEGLIQKLTSVPRLWVMSGLWQANVSDYVMLLGLVQGAR